MAAVAAELKPGKTFAYKPFYPDRWKAKEQSTELHPWEGEHTVFLTTSPDLDPKTMAIFLERLDGGWKVYADLVGRTPHRHLTYSNKPTIAAVPDASYTCGLGCGFLGATGVEVGGFYDHDYPLVQKQPKAFPHLYFYEIGRNYFLFGDQIPDSATGFAVFMRYVCMDTLGCEDPDQRTREAIEKAESLAAQSDLSFAQLFTNSAGIGEKAGRIKGLSPSDQPVMYASVMLKLRRDHGGDAWTKRFFHALAQCPKAPRSGTAESAKVQSLNWLVAASCAAKQDLSGLFVERWRMTLDDHARATLAKIDWTAADLSPGDIVKSLSAE